MHSLAKFLNVTLIDHLCVKMDLLQSDFLCVLK